MSFVQLNEIVKMALASLIIQTTTNIGSDIYNGLSSLKDKEKNNPIALSQLELMVDNFDYAKANTLPLCQDTGTANFFIQLGQNFPIISDFHEIILEVLQELTSNARLRPNTVDPVSQQNALTNGGEGMPPIYLEIIPDRDDLIITYLAKGGGAENISRLFMLSASSGWKEIIPSIERTLKEAGGNPCPPVILGIGIGGDAVKAMFLAKKALLRPLGSRNHRPEISALEEDLLDHVNQLNIGIMGLGGNSNCLDVRIEWAMRHPASFPVGLIVQCYCHRSHSMQITYNGSIKYGTLDDNFQFQSEDDL